MIKTKSDLRQYLEIEKDIYSPIKKRDIILAFICKDYTHDIWSYTKCLRKSEYHFNNCTYKVQNVTITGIVHNLMYIVYRAKRNRLGKKLNFEIYENNFDLGLCIYHSIGGVLLNGSAKIGKNCKLHGNNCIGNNGLTNQAPILGDNVDIGYGAIIIGGVVIGSNTIIAAGAVVVDSFPQGGVVLGGIPAKVIKECN